MPRILHYKITQRSGQENRSGSDQVSETHILAVDEAVTLAWIRNHPSTPKIGMPAAPGYWWDSFQVSQKAKLIFELSVSASPFTFDPIPDSPLARRAEISVDSELVEEPTLFDATGKPIMNRAGEWIQGVSRERPLLTYLIEKNLARDPAWLETHLGAVNRDSVTLRGRVCPPNTLMLRRLSLGKYVTENRDRFSPCSIALHYDPLTWIRRIWNRGTIQLVKVPRVINNQTRLVWVQARIKSGSPPQNIEEPVPLDKRGQVIDGVLTPENDTPVDVSKMVILDFHVQPVQNFRGVLPLT